MNNFLKNLKIFSKIFHEYSKNISPKAIKKGTSMANVTLVTPNNS
jgi:hypothetical protein